MTAAELRSKLDKALEFLVSELAQIRTGRASPTLLEDIPVFAYDTQMTIKEVGNVTVADSQSLLIVLWDRSLINEVARAVRESDLKLNPVVGGDSVRVPIPPLTEERRKELVRVVSSKVEATKNTMRLIRQDAMKDIDKQFADKQIGEDEKFSGREETEEIVKEYTDKADEMGERKKEDVMTV